MLVLGLDTALKSCSAAILRDGRVLGDRFAPLVKGHAEYLAPMVAEALAEAEITARDLDRVGVVIGPGGFAGVRVGLAFARGLAIGTRIAVVGVTSLEALALAMTPRRGAIRAAVIDARRGQVYAALYDQAGDVILAPFVATPAEALERLRHAAHGAAVDATGDGVSLLAEAPANWSTRAAGAIDAKVVARLAAAAPMPSRPPAPVYLRPPDAAPAKPSPLAGVFQGTGEA